MQEELTAKIFLDYIHSSELEEESEGQLLDDRSAGQLVSQPASRRQIWIDTLRESSKKRLGLVRSDLRAVEMNRGSEKERALN